MDPLWTTVTALALLGSALVAGVFFAFSTFVMRGLDLAGADVAAPAMRGINVTALRPPLMLALFGTALLAVVLGIVALVSWTPASPWLLAAGAVYLLGEVVVTAVGNVPLNQRIDRETGGAYWREFLPKWNRWNHVRTIAGVAAAAGYLVALLVA